MNREDLIKIKNEKRGDTVIYSLINTIIGECDRINKNLSEEEIQTIIKKIIKNNEISLHTIGLGDIEIENLRKENHFLNQFLPKQLSDSEMVEIINGIKEDVGEISIPIIMKYFNTHHRGCFNGKILSDLVKKML